jgi:hypothetical protein
MHQRLAQQAGRINVAAVAAVAAAGVPARAPPPSRLMPSGFQLALLLPG